MERREPDPTNAARRILGCRRSAVVEILAYLAVALAFDQMIGGGHRFADVAPHPFWAPVLLASTYYGINEGLFAAAASTLALLLGNLPEQSFSEDVSAWLLRITAEPVLWFVAAIILGEICGKHRREAGLAHEALRDTAARVDAITRAYDQLSLIKGNLETRVAAQIRTVHAMYVASRAITRETIGEVLLGTSEMVRAVLGPRKFSLFLLNGPRLEAALNEGWASEDRFSREFRDSSAIFERIVERREFLRVTDPAHEAVLHGEGLLAGPLISVDTREVVGMLKVEDLDFLDLTPSSIQNFQILCEWIGTSLADSQRREHLRLAPFFDPNRKLMSYALFEQVAGMFEQLGPDVRLDVSFVLVALDLPPDSRAAERLAATRQFAETVSCLTPLSGFDYQKDGWDFVVLLPGYELAAADAFGQRLVHLLNDQIRSVGLLASPRYVPRQLRRTPGQEAGAAAERNQALAS
jgi:hypothetical protein